jgi:hypothetical protein
MGKIKSYVRKGTYIFTIVCQVIDRIKVTNVIVNATTRKDNSQNLVFIRLLLLSRIKISIRC